MHPKRDNPKRFMASAEEMTGYETIIFNYFGSSQGLFTGLRGFSRANHFIFFVSHAVTAPWGLFDGAPRLGPKFF